MLNETFLHSNSFIMNIEIHLQTYICTGTAGASQIQILLLHYMDKAWLVYIIESQS